MEVNKVDFFSDNTRHLSTNYDYNKDGTVDIQDYNFALLSLEDDDPDNDVELSKDDLKAVFSDLIKEDDKVNPDNVNVNADNVTKLSQEVVDNASKSIMDPSKASSFEELQEIGKNLSKVIKRCTKILPYLNDQMKIYNKQLEEISKDKAAKEKEYEEMEGEVNQKNDELAGKMSDAMSQSETVTQEMRNKNASIISSCVERYKNGEYEGQDLYSVITENLAHEGSCATSVDGLNALISDCGSLGNEIKDLCGDIENLVADIRSVTQKFNSTTGMLNSLKDSRNGVLTTSNRASAEYQKGYERRQELRKEISSQFGTGTSGLKAFLNSEMSTKIPFSDAYAVMAEIGKNTGINFTNGNIIMPNFVYMVSESEITAEERAQMAEFNEISDLVNSKFASDKSNAQNAQYNALANSAPMAAVAMANMLSGSNNSQAKSAASKIDTNGNGKVSKDEIKKAYDKAVKDDDFETQAELEEFMTIDDNGKTVFDKEAFEDAAGEQGYISADYFGDGFDDFDDEAAGGGTVPGGAATENGNVTVNADDVNVEDDELDEEEFNTGEPTCLGCCTKSTCCDPISFKNGNTSYHFISDNDNDGTFDGPSEFLGAKKGWEEMKAYDTDGNGKVDGAELEKLKLVSTNDESGQYTFMTAAEAGIEEIDLSSYEKSNTKQADGDMLRGTFDLKMTDGTVIQGEQTDDTKKNILNRYSTLFGAQITDLSKDYEDNMFMDDFVERVDTRRMTNTNDSDFNSLKRSSEDGISSAKIDGDSDAKSSSETATEEKKSLDAKKEVQRNENKKNL